MPGAPAASGAEGGSEREDPMKGLLDAVREEAAMHGAPVDITAGVQSAADMSPTAGQMPRLVGLGHASRLYRELPGLAGALAAGLHLSGAEPVELLQWDG